MAESENLPALGETWRDRLTSLTKGGLGAIPFAGAIIAEVVGMIVPNQRLERIEAYLLLLSDQLKHLDSDALRERFVDPEVVDLFEEGAAQSARAISDERKVYIARLVAVGITGDEKERIEAKRLLKLLEAIDDDQIIILTSYLHRYARDDAFHEKHAAVLDPVSVHIGSSRDELDAGTMRELARSELVRLGLLRPTYKTPRKGELPEFDDKTGMMKAMSKDVTPLGRLLLSRIGVSAPGDF